MMNNTGTHTQTINTRSGATEITRSFKVIEWTAADEARWGKMNDGLVRIEYTDEYVDMYGAKGFIEAATI